LRVSMLNE